MKNYLITGGAGFIGSNFIRNLLKSESKCKIINLDLLTYAGSKKTIDEFNKYKNYTFIKGNIKEKRTLKYIFNKFKPESVVNFAAETHVDRSIDKPNDFIQTNILGSFELMNYSFHYWKKNKKRFKFIQISTDEVYGSVDKGSSNEFSIISPNSPYSASKTSADNIGMSFFKTYNFPITIARPSNNYGPYQFPEKLIPLVILNAINEKPLPIYGNGKHIRNWLYVDDCVNALKVILNKAKPGNIYNIGGPDEVSNIELVKKICKILDIIVPRKNKKKYENLIKFVLDRPGHDKRYSLNSSKIRNEFNWHPKVKIDQGIQLTVDWYLKNENWWNYIRKFKYRGKRIGLKHEKN